jgi:hypothetical protein
MKTIQKKIVVDEAGEPREVIISWDDFVEVSELLGLDLDDEAIDDLRQARSDREAGVEDAFVDLASIP